MTTLITIILIILINGIYVAGEFAIARVRPSKVDEIIASNPRSKLKKLAALQLKKILADISSYISTCQVMITICNLLIGAIAEPKIEKFIGPLFENTLPFVDTTIFSLIISILLISFVHVVLGELVPKNLTLVNPEKAGLFLAYFLTIAYKIYKYPVILLNKSSDLVLFLFGIKRDIDAAAYSETELKIIINRSKDQGILGEQENAIIQKIFDFNDVLAYEIMTPRKKLLCLDENKTIKDAIKLIGERKISRIPVYLSNVDNITGYIKNKDLAENISKGKDNLKLYKIKKPILSRLANIKAIDLIQDMQKDKTQIALLLSNNLRRTEGIVTLEDIIEEIFGEFYEEHEIIEDDSKYRINNLNNL